MILKFKKLHVLAIAPSYATSGAAGFDISASEDAMIEPGEFATVNTGLAFEIPDGFEIQMRPRSGMSFKSGSLFKNTIGTIDADYRGEVRVCLANIGREPLKIRAGDRIAQGVFTPVCRAELVEAEELSETARGSSGFGSTGR